MMGLFFMVRAGPRRVLRSALLAAAVLAGCSAPVAGPAAGNASAPAVPVAGAVQAAPPPVAARGGPSETKSAETMSAAEFCAPFTALATASCSARYSCGQPALAELNAAACTCRNQGAPPPDDRQRLTELRTSTRAFACCSGIAIARNGAGCR